MKKILLSIATIALVGALGFAATNAFFTDTETSTGNTFQAGTMGLNKLKYICDISSFKK